MELPCASRLRADLGGIGDTTDTLHLVLIWWTGFWIINFIVVFLGKPGVTRGKPNFKNHMHDVYIYGKPHVKVKRCIFSPSKARIRSTLPSLSSSMGWMPCEAMGDPGYQRRFVCGENDGISTQNGDANQQSYSWS
jgi:hypothetical protein